MLDPAGGEHDGNDLIRCSLRSFLGAGTCAGPPPVNTPALPPIPQGEPPHHAVLGSPLGAQSIAGDWYSSDTGMATAAQRRGAAASTGGSGGRRLSPWLAPSPGKRWTELFFLAYSPSWIIWCLCILVPFKIYEVRGSWVEGQGGCRYCIHPAQMRCSGRCLCCCVPTDNKCRGKPRVGYYVWPAPSAARPAY